MTPATLSNDAPAWTRASYAERHPEIRFVDADGNIAYRQNADSTWPWRRADGRTYAEADPIGRIARNRWGRCSPETVQHARAAGAAGLGEG